VSGFVDYVSHEGDLEKSTNFRSTLGVESLIHWAINASISVFISSSSSESFGLLDED